MRDITGKLSIEVVFLLCFIVLFYLYMFCCCLCLQLDNVPIQLLVELSDVIIDGVRKGKASNGRY